jgi:hypothetical protein
MEKPIEWLIENFAKINTIIIFPAVVVILGTKSMGADFSSSGSPSSSRV